MPPSSNNQHDDILFKNLIHQTMLFVNSSRPCRNFEMFELFWFASASFGVIFKFVYEFLNFLQQLFLTTFHKPQNVLFSNFSQFNFIFYDKRLGKK